MARYQKGPGASEGHQTLGYNVIPIRYDLRLKPNFTTFKYKGSEAISVQIKNATMEVSLNSAEIYINSASVIANGSEQKAAVKSNPKDQTTTLILNRAVKGSALIKIDFTGTHNENMYGFYRSRYVSEGKTRYLVTTQFEAANARNAFPCFDEPAFKAVFNVTMVVDDGIDCISNMPISVIKPLGDGTNEVRFGETPPMSTYLLYLGAGNYDYTNGKSGSTNVRVITTPGNGHLASLPLKYAIKFINFYERYFGIKYPLPKVDLIAIPDFSAGAMENWGAMTFRETALLADNKTSVAGKQRVAEVIAHELTHQWFGDLVTMRWWNDLWLNESFATFMSYKAMDAVFPEWGIKVEYLKDVINTAFAADQLRSTHPISVDVNLPEEIDEMFDEISYEKGGTVLNMIENYAGEGIFRDGLRRYLKKHSYSNATKSDLWHAIDAVASSKSRNMSVYDVASYWIDKPGYPIVDVKRSGERIRLSQKRYFLLGGLSDRGVWPIPVDYMLDGKENKMLFRSRTAELNAGKWQWIKLNSGQNGLYRVSYADDNLERLGDLVKSKEISGVDSWGIEFDMFARSRSGRIKADRYLEFIERYCLDGGHPLNSNVLSHLGWLYDRLGLERNARVKELLLLYSNRLIGRLGWDRDQNESTFDTEMRSAAIIQSGMAGCASTLDKANRLFNDFIMNDKAIDPNIRGAVYSLAARSGGERTFSILKKRFTGEKVPDEKIRFLSATAMFNDQKLLLKSFDYAMSDAVRLQDSFIVLAIAAGNPAARDILLSWTKSHWKELKRRYASGTHMLSRFVSNLAVLSTDEDRREIEGFFRSKQNFRGDIGKALDKSLEQIEANIRFMKANEQ